MESAAPEPVAALLAARHVAHVLAMHQAMARIRQAIMRPDLAPALLSDALDVMEHAAAPVRTPARQYRQSDARRAYMRDRKRAQRERAKQDAEG